MLLLLANYADERKTASSNKMPLLLALSTTTISQYGKMQIFCLVLFVLQIVIKNGKVEIGKWFFAGCDIKNVEPKARLFYVKLFSDRNVSI